MDRFDRIYQLHRVLAARKSPVSLEELKTKLECSRATVSRIIRQMRDYYQAPIECSKTGEGYYYDNQNAAHPYELPGLWFNSQ